MTGEPKASQSPSEASKTRYHACIVEYFICSSLVNSYTNYSKFWYIFEKKNRMSFTRIALETHITHSHMSTGVKFYWLASKILHG
jgi:hypothetical protein